MGILSSFVGSDDLRWYVVRGPWGPDVRDEWVATNYAPIHYVPGDGENLSFLPEEERLTHFSLDVRSKVPSEAERNIERAQQLKDLGVYSHVRRTIALDRLSNLVSLGLAYHHATGFGHCESLRELVWSNSTQQGFPEVEDARGLEKLSLLQWRNLTDLHSVQRLQALRVLELGVLPKVARLPPLDSLRCLNKLDLFRLPVEIDLRFVRHLPNLATLFIQRCAGVDTLAPLVGHPTLRQVSIEDTPIRDGNLRQILEAMPTTSVGVTPRMKHYDVTQAEMLRLRQNIQHK